MSMRKLWGLTKYDDHDLLRRYRKSRDLSYVAELYDRYLERIFGVCLAYLKDPAESQDISAEIFEVIVEKSLTHNIQEFEKWIYVVTKNQCLQFIRKKNTHLKQINSYEFMQLNGVEHPLEEKEHQFSWMEECLEQLPENQKACISRFYLKNQSYDEISRQLNIPKNNVRSHIQNGRRNLKLCMQKKNEQAE